ncbi:agmatinase family protein [Marivirga atlantica]|jgi:agmatinase|uniref:Agmatinase family protein n=1 Tax=Marivirga atlantica TaxID=1548457 RepID=A0A937AKN1_9BACT|nr:agmatinase family protein [Marivirga atlantica]MBL0765298.1 agmatinase family protein [Marivirga atlantica]
MSNKEKLIADFDPNGLGTSGNIFALPFDEETADLVLIPVPWEVTVSYAAGTAKGPEHILEASSQVDLFQKDVKDAWKMGIAYLDTAKGLEEKSEEYRTLAEQYIQLLEKEEAESSMAKDILKKINKACAEMVQVVKSEASAQLKKGKLVGLVGGDHSTPLGFIQALAEKYDSFGVLQIDAHMDLRKAYEDFEYSHASISYNFMKLPQIEKLVQVGIRDFCEEEYKYAERHSDRVTVFYDEDVKHGIFDGESWNIITDRIISELPQKVYISFDIDGLNPELCPNTGTPVPGGLKFAEATYLLQKLVKSGREIIGFDLNEVAPGESDWNGNVGARMLYKLCNLMGVSNDKLEWSEY